MATIFNLASFDQALLVTPYSSEVPTLTLPQPYQYGDEWFPYCTIDVPPLGFCSSCCNQEWKFHLHHWREIRSKLSHHCDKMVLLKKVYHSWRERGGTFHYKTPTWLVEYTSKYGKLVRKPIYIDITHMTDLCLEIIAKRIKRKPKIQSIMPSTLGPDTNSRYFAPIVFEEENDLKKKKEKRRVYDRSYYCKAKENIEPRRDDEAKVNEKIQQLEEIENQFSNKESESSALGHEESNLTTEIAIAHEKVEAIHRSWQAQAIVLGEKQQEIDGLQHQLEQLRKDAQDVKESLLEEQNECQGLEHLLALFAAEPLSPNVIKKQQECE